MVLIWIYNSIAGVEKAEVEETNGLFGGEHAEICSRFLKNLPTPTHPWLPLQIKFKFRGGAILSKKSKQKVLEAKSALLCKPHFPGQNASLFIAAAAAQTVLTFTSIT